MSLSLTDITPYPITIVPGSIPKIIFEAVCKGQVIFAEKLILNKSIKILINTILGPLLFLVLSWSLYKQTIHQPDLYARWQGVKESFFSPALWLACLLMPVNWGIEARKWQLQLQPLERISFITAFKSVLAGCSITMITPFRVGEYAGRILYLKEENRTDAIPINILGSISQLFITLLMGTLGLIYLKLSGDDLRLFKSLPAYSGAVFLSSGIIASGIFLLIYFRVGLLIRVVARIKYVKKFVSHLTLLNSFSRKQLLRILFLSFFRYMVFILQYVLLLHVMQAEIGFFTCFKLLTVFYLIIALAPTIGFTELPLRAATGVLVLQLYSNNILGIQAASLGIWIINLVLPAIAGSLLILGIKILKER